jgi:trans-aconitate methyltransferase
VPADQSASSAQRLHELHRRRLLGILSGTWTAQACYVLAKLGLPDRMAAGAHTTADLAGWAGVDAGALRRLLGALVVAGLLREPAPDTFALTPVTELLRSDVPGSTRQTAIMYGEEVFGAFGELLWTVRTGAPAFASRHGRPFYEYLADHPERAETFHAAMGGQPVPATLAGVPLDGVHTVVDLGGGDGSLLATVLARQPTIQGVLVELPEAARQARERLAERGVLDRVRIVEGSFFDTVPGDGDLYVLCRVLHNWTDMHALQLLRQLHASMAPGARLVVAETLLADPLTQDGQEAGATRSRMVDLLMLVMLEGRDRTASEYCNLLASAGFQVVRTDETGSGEGVVEALR